MCLLLSRCKQITTVIFLLLDFPEPIAFYPLNARYEAREKENRQLKGIVRDVAITNGPYNEPGGACMFYGTESSYIVFPNNGGLDIRFSGPFQTPLHSCAEPNWWVKYGRRAAFESVWFGRSGLVRQTTLNSAASAALCDVGAAADSYGVLLMCRT